MAENDDGIDIEQLPFLTREALKISDCCYSCAFSKLHLQSKGIPYIMMCKKWRSKLSGAYALIRWYHACGKFERKTDEDIERLTGTVQGFIDSRFHLEE
jgi:hypothetical protein